MNHKPRGALLGSSNLLEALLSHSPDPVLVFDQEGTLLDLSPAAERLFGFARVWALGRKVQDLLFSGSQTDQADQGWWLEENVTETWAQVADGARVQVQVAIGRVEGEDPALFVAYLSDLSALKQSQATVRDVEERFTKIFKDGPIGIALISPSSQLITTNDALCAMLGVAADEVEAVRLDSLTHRDDALMCSRRLTQLFDGKSSGTSFEMRLLSKDENVVWVHLHASLVLDVAGDPLYCLCIIEDITKRRLAEEERNNALEVLRRTDEQRQDLLGRLVDAQEAERRLIAADIHDDSVQIMAAAAIRLEKLAGQLTDPVQVNMLNNLMDTVRLSIVRLRSLLFELTPTILDHDGLAAAIKAKLDELSEEMGLRYEIHNKLQIEPPEHSRVIAYRIISEVIANVRKHSAASNVDVSIESREEGVLVKVTDNGKGFEDRALSSAGHLGMSSIKERAQVSGGWSRVVSGLGKGTAVEFWIPNGKPSSADVKVTIDVSEERSPVREIGP